MDKYSREEKKKKTVQMQIDCYELCVSKHLCERACARQRCDFRVISDIKDSIFEHIIQFRLRFH